MADLLHSELNVLNVGLQQFTDALDAQNIKVLQVDWRPPMEDDDEIDDLLSSLL